MFKRFEARFIDSIIAITLFVLIAYYTGFYSYINDVALKYRFSYPFVYSFLGLFFFVFLEAIMISTIGTTFGKYLLGITVRSYEGKKLTALLSLKRSFLVWMQGLSIGIWIFMAIAILVQAIKLKKTGMTTYDMDMSNDITVKKLGKLHSFVMVFITFFMFMWFGVNYKFSKDAYNKASSFHILYNSLEYKKMEVEIMESNNKLKFILPTLDKSIPHLENIIMLFNKKEIQNRIKDLDKSIRILDEEKQKTIEIQKEMYNKLPKILFKKIFVTTVEESYNKVFLERWELLQEYKLIFESNKKMLLLLRDNYGKYHWSYVNNFIQFEDKNIEAQFSGIFENFTSLMFEDSKKLILQTQEELKLEKYR